MVKKLECLKPVRMSGHTDPFQNSQESGKRDKKCFSRYIIGKAILKETGNKPLALLNILEDISKD